MLEPCTSLSGVERTDRTLRQKGYNVQGQRRDYAVLRFGQIIASHQTYAEAYADALMRAGIAQDEDARCAYLLYKYNLI